MGTRAELLLAILLGALVIAIAFWTGHIGGGGAGASRYKNPFLFWLGVSTTAVFSLIAVAMLVSTFV